MPRLRHATIADAADALAIDPKSTTAWSLPSIATASTRRFAVNYVGLGELAKARASSDRSVLPKCCGSRLTGSGPICCGRRTAGALRDG
jgi:hypothetical protein